MIGVVIINLLPGGALAVDQSWSFTTAGDYTLSSASTIEVTGTSSRLKVQNYSSDSSTAALYHLDESNGTSAADSSSNANTGTVTGGTFETGNLNNGLTLNGTTGQISVSDSASLSLSQANTIEAWTKFSSAFSSTSHSQRQTIADKGEYQLYYDQGTGKIKYELADSNNTWTQSAGNALNGSWDLNGKPAVHLVNDGSTIYAGIGGRVLNVSSTGNDINSEVWSWNGSTWTKIGGSGLNSSWGTDGSIIESVESMAVMDGNLYVGLGETAGDGDVWKWNGSVWSKIGGDGINSSWAANVYQSILSLTSDGTNLYAGSYTSASAGLGDVWKWNGTSWSQIGGDGLNSGWAASTIEGVASLNYFGGTLYAGTMETAGDGDVWSWNGSAWTQIGGDGLNSGWAGSAIERVYSLANDGTNLYAGTGLTAGDGDVWKWNGSAWSQIGGDGLNSSWAASTYEMVGALTWDGTTLYAGLGNGSADGEVWSWNGSAWTQIGGDSLNSMVTSVPEEISLQGLLSVSGTVYAATYDSALGGGEVWSWNGSAWTHIGGQYLNNSWGYYGIESVASMTTSNDKLYAGVGTGAGDAMVFEFDGSTWTLVGGQGRNSSWATKTFETVASMITYKNKLYVGLGSSANDAEVWQYDGASWSQVGGDSLNSGWTTGYETVSSMAIHNGVLYAGLGISAGDGEIWGWDGSSWTKIGGDGLNSSPTLAQVSSLVSWQGNLYADFDSGSAGTADVWQWNGSVWTQIGGDGLNSSWAAATYQGVYSMTTHGGKLIAGLGISSAGFAEVWEYDGSAWTQIGGDGINSSWSDSYEKISSMTTYNGDLYAGLGNGAGDAELWKLGGSSWSKVAGDGVNTGWTGSLQDEVNVLGVYNGKLYAGLGNTTNLDAAIWAYGNNAVLSSVATSQDTNWHHIAATYDGVTMKIYIDGVLNASQSAATSMPDGSHTLLIGTSQGRSVQGETQGYFQGSIDEIRISNTARSSFTTTPYTASAQTVQPTSAVLTSGVKSWDGFSVSETANGGTVTYRLSNDGGTTWSYYSSGWTTSSSTSQANASSVINTNIPTFTVGSGGILWQAVLTGNGNQQVTLSSVTISYTADTTPPTNPTSTAGLNQNGGVTSLTSGNWYNYSAPYFSWTGALDTGGSGVSGYYVYFGTDNTAEPTTAGAFQAAANYTASGLSSGSTYYLRIKTRDVAQNTTATTYDAFTYKYDSTTPTNPAFVSVNPSGYTSTNSFTFIWPSTGASMASDADSGIAGYQYKTGASSGLLSSYSNTTTETQITIADAAYQEGSNTFYLRTVDNAGNTSNPVTATYYFNESAPTAPQNLVATPTSNTSNSFAFSWDAPATYSGNASELTYYYSINAVPTSGNVTSNGSSTSLSAGAYATQQGDNTFYVVAKDAANNINYSAYASTTFTATTTAPGQPLNLTIADSSNRATSKYRLSLTWEAPSSGGTVSTYKVHRATDGLTFSQVGSTSSTGYIDSDLSSSLTYSYKVYAVDSAGSTSVASSTVSKQPTGKYTTPPTITTDPSATPGATSVTIAWSTDRNSDAFVEYGTTTDYGLSFGQREDKTTHSVTISGLTPGTIYHYRVQSLDSGDLRDYSSDAGKSGDFTFETAAAPGLSNVSFSDITTNSAILSFETSKASTSTIDYGTSTNYGFSLSDDSSGTTTKHTLRLKDLADGTTYQLRITIEDADGNTVASPGHAFTTIAKPKISNVRFETLQNEAQTTVKVTWTTNVDTTGSVLYTSDSGERKEIATSEYKTTHEFIIRGLKDQSTYRFQGISRDKFGNEAASDTNTVATPVDTRAPQLKNLTVEIRSSGVSETQKAQLVVSWETDEPATSAIEYGPGISSDNYTAKSQEDATLTTNHVVIVSELEPSKLYHLRAISKDHANNEGKSSDTTAITGKIQRSVIDIIINSLQRSFGFLSRLRGNR